MVNLKRERRIRRHKKIRSEVSGTAQRPRVSVFKSNADLYVQVIDDTAGNTLMSASTSSVSKKGTKIEKAKELGVALAKDISSKKITEAVFDRGGNLYTGRVAAVADGLREGGLKI